MDIQTYMQTIGQQAKQAGRILANADVATKNTALRQMAQALLNQADWLKAENEKDLTAGRDKGLSPPMLDRLRLGDKVIHGMAEGVRQITDLPDPVGVITDMAYRPTGIQVGRMRVPLGVIGIIYESRPNVTIDAASLCLKSGNAAILRGGSEALHSNQAIASCVQAGLQAANLPAECVQVVKTADRSAVGELLKMNDTVDIIIPRGGKSLIERVSSESTIPVLKHLDGVCHLYIDNEADLEKALPLTINSKTDRYSACNSLETLLVAESVASTILPQLAEAFVPFEMELRGCEKTRAILPDCKIATEEDWGTEYLGAILSVRVVDDIDSAIEHINQYGSQHTDTIVTENYSKARHFLRAVDSSSVMVNASTRFADGFEFGLGAEIGISTDKLHARGPVGLEGLTSQKYIVLGEGQVR